MSLSMVASFPGRRSTLSPLAPLPLRALTLALAALHALYAPPPCAARSRSSGAAGTVSASTLPKNKAFVPTALFKSDDEVDQAILESNPWLFVHSDFDIRSSPILIVGMDGWGGRAENLIELLRLGLRDTGRTSDGRGRPAAPLTRRLVLAAIQDPATRGPQFQGQWARAHANQWILVHPVVPALHRFIARIAEAYAPAVHSGAAPLQVYFVGFSTGGTAAPVVAVRVARLGHSPSYRIAGSVSVGGWTHGDIAPAVRALRQRVAFIVAPRKRRNEPKARRYDQFNRDWAESSHAQLRRGKADSELVHIDSARRHLDWHWGLMSQCRFFPKGKRVDRGRGHWPNYSLPNPDTFHALREFIEGRPLPRTSPQLPPTSCPY